MRTDGTTNKQTNNMAKQPVATHNFANAPKNDKIFRLKKYTSFNKAMNTYSSNNSLGFSYRLMLCHFMFYKKA